MKKGDIRYVRGNRDEIGPDFKPKPNGKHMIPVRIVGKLFDLNVYKVELMNKMPVKQPVIKFDLHCMAR